MANAICSFVYISLAIRALGLRDFGILILIHSLATTASTITRLQSWQTMIHFDDAPFKSGDKGLLKQVIGFCIRLDLLSALAAVIFGLVSIIFYSFTSGWTSQERLLAFAYLDCLPFQIYRLGAERPTPDRAIRSCARDRFGDGIVPHIRRGDRFLCAYDAAFFCRRLGRDGSTGFALFIFFAIRTLRKDAHIRLDWQSTPLNWKWRLEGMWAFTRSTSLNQTLSLVAGNVSTLIVGNLLGLAEAAIFRICRQIADGIVTPAQLLSPVLYPELTRLRAERNWKGLARVTWKIFAILCAVSVALLIVSARRGGIFALMLHLHVKGGTHYISIMLVAAAFSLLIVPLEPMLIVMGHVSRLVRSRSILLLLYFPILVVLTRRFSLTGACYTAAICNFAVLIYWIWSARRCTPWAIKGRARAADALVIQTSWWRRAARLRRARRASIMRRLGESVHFLTSKKVRSPQAESVWSPSR
ncbi:MAG: lipopolysaccharide biosynthesis protein [Acetobacteraceae bacterium]